MPYYSAVPLENGWLPSALLAAGLGKGFFDVVGAAAAASVDAAVVHYWAADQAALGVAM